MRTTQPFRRIEPQGHGATCSLCGKSGLEWGTLAGRRTLINEIGRAHKCDPKMMREHLTAAFDEGA